MHEAGRRGSWASKIALCDCGDIVVKRHWSGGWRYGYRRLAAKMPPLPPGGRQGVWVHVDQLGNPHPPAPGWPHGIVQGTIRDVLEAPEGAVLTEEGVKRASLSGLLAEEAAPPLASPAPTHQ